MSRGVALFWSAYDFSVLVLYVITKMLKVPNASPLLQNQNCFLFAFAFHLLRVLVGGSVAGVRVFLRKVAMPCVDRGKLLSATARA